MHQHRLPAGGAAELLEHAEDSLGIGAGGTTPDGTVTLEEAECLADCDRTPCVQVNHRYVGAQTPESFDRLIADLRSGARDGEIPPHGTLIRVRRTNGLGPSSPRWSPSERRAEAQASGPPRRRGQRDSVTGGGGLMAITDPPKIVTPGWATTTRTRSSATWPPGATTGCARRSP